MRVADGEGLALMGQYLAEYRIMELYALIERLKGELQGRQLGAVYLCGAELKLFLLDTSFADDLDRAAALLDGDVEGLSYLAEFVPLDPNNFILFHRKAGSVAAFLKVLRGAEKSLEKLCGYAGLSMARQLECEILYYTGNTAQAAAMARQQLELNLARRYYYLALMAGYVLVRCQLAEGDAAGAYDTIRQIILLSKDEKRPYLAQMYATVRSWLNLTTGWSGETPRFNVTPTGREFPVLDDRLDAMQAGIARLGPTEAPFAEAARQLFGEVCTFRELFVDIFEAMLDYRNNGTASTGRCFETAYKKAHGNGIILPFAEYGRQIVPLIEHVVATNTAGTYDPEWLARVATMALKYERGLEYFRG